MVSRNITKPFKQTNPNRKPMSAMDMGAQACPSMSAAVLLGFVFLKDASLNQSQLHRLTREDEKLSVLKNMPALSNLTTGDLMVSIKCGEGACRGVSRL